MAAVYDTVMHMNVRIATYNLFEGAGGSYNRLVEFVREADLDVLCLQEINHWQDNDFARLKDFTDKVLFASYAFGNSNTEYKLATISKRAILDKDLHAEAFWHAALEVRVQLEDTEISIFNVHLDPWQEGSRDKEIARLLAAVDPHRPTIITGDFNSLSRQDNYSPEMLVQLKAKGISKYGTNALEFTVIDRLLQAGFVDVAAAAGNFEPTVPSTFNTDQDHEVPARIDYMFVTPDLAPLVKSVERMKSDLTDSISDHYPLIATFQFGVSTTPDISELPPVPGAPRPLLTPPNPFREVPEPWTPPADPTPPPKEAKNEEDQGDGEVVMWTHDEK
jgi:exodeoxyribonuclease III